MPSALFSVGGSSAQVAQVVSLFASVPLAIVNTAGIDHATWAIVGQSHADVAPTLTVGANGLTATIAFNVDPSHDQSVLLECRANGGRGANGAPDARLICRRVIGTNGATGIVPVAMNESFERDAIVGWAQYENGARPGSIRVNGTPVTSVNFSDSFVPTYSGGTSLIERRDEIIFRPTLGLDDWDDLVPIWTAEYAPDGKRRKIKLAPGNYKAVTNGLMPPGLQLECMPGVDIECAVPSPSTISPYRGPFVSGPILQASVVTLSVAVVVGDSQVTVASSITPVVGQTYVFVDNLGLNKNESFEILSFTGAGPYVVKLSHAFMFARPIATTNITNWAPNRGIRLIGNGARIHGVYERALSIAVAYDCLISDFVVDASGATEYAASIDQASERSMIQDIFMTGVNGGIYGVGIALEYGYRNTMRRCRIQGAGILAGSWGDQDQIDDVECIGAGADGGLGVLVIGHKIALSKISTVNCYSGVEFRQAQGAVLSGGSIVNSNVGITFDGIATAKTTAVVKDIDIYNAPNGFYRVEAYADAVFEDCNMQLAGQTTFAGRVLDATSSVKIIRGLVAPGGAGAYVGLISNGGTIDIQDITYDGTAMQNNALAVLLYAGSIKARKIKFIWPNLAASTLFYSGAGTVIDINEISVSGSAPTNGVNMTDATARCWSGIRAPLNECVTPYSVTGQKNFGTVALNGATPVTLPFSLAMAGSRVTATRRTIAGTPGHFTVATSGGVGGTLTGTAGDTSTVEWRID